MFCAYLEWFQRSSLKRFAASFDRNVYPKNVEPRLNEVKESIQEIEKEVTLVTQTRVKEMYQSLWKDAAQQRKVANGSRQDDVLMSQERLSRFGETLGYSSIQSLGAVEQKTVYGRLICHTLSFEPSLVDAIMINIREADRGSCTRAKFARRIGKRTLCYIRSRTHNCTSYPPINLKGRTRR